LTNCDDKITEDPCSKVPTNLHYTKVSYQYSGGILTRAGVTLVWDSVNYATGYKLFIKDETGKYEFEKSTTGNTVYVYQSIGGSTTYVVTAFNSECESDYSGEYTLEIEK
jgi:hypothetical protein